MMMVFLVLLGIEGLSYMLNDENKNKGGETMRVKVRSV